MCKLAHGLILNPCASLHLLPVFRDQRRRLCPRLFYQGVLEPLVTKVSVLGDNQLEAGDILLGELQQQLEQPAHGIEVGVGFGLLCPASVGIGVFLDLS